MAFGLVSSREEFLRRLSEALDGLSGVTVVADDILIYGKGDNKEEAMNDHNRNLISNLTKTNVNFCSRNSHTSVTSLLIMV